MGLPTSAALRAAGPEELRHVLAFLDRMSEGNRQADERLACGGATPGGGRLAP
ncbi:hypothetical protein [Microlunatus flavus]|uniref:Uncharacterized protein n=1 Tax=Microlunatus flavus TaxID=1036181 RepID=A0A1H9I4Q4_9ACTN|nr:hypothetical protein [Microlunatus flavus]SEQ69482.1 hypothetical protein SAMN05421756_10579 [Microlunatus flavus]